MGVFIYKLRLVITVNKALGIFRKGVTTTTRRRRTTRVGIRDAFQSLKIADLNDVSVVFYIRLVIRAYNITI